MGGQAAAAAHSLGTPLATISVVAKELKKEIGETIKKHNMGGQIDVFSLDMDGVDYWILKELDVEKINVICCEYNHYLGNNVSKTMFML